MQLDIRELIALNKIPTAWEIDCLRDYSQQELSQLLLIALEVIREKNEELKCLK